MGLYEPLPAVSDPYRPNAARLYDYYLGGTDNLEVDRRAAEKIRAVVPEMSDAAWANRGFLQRATKWIAEQGVRQFSTSAPACPPGTTHTAAQNVDPECRVVYVDNDPSTVTHSRQLLAGARNVVYIEGDLRDPTGILGRAEVRDLLDFDQPIGLIAVAVVHFVSPHFKPHRLISRYMSALASGSYLALSHATADRMADHVIETILSVYDNASEKLYFRTREEIAQFRRDGDGAPICGGTPKLTYSGWWGAEDLELADSDG